MIPTIIAIDPTTTKRRQIRFRGVSFLNLKGGRCNCVVGCDGIVARGTYGVVVSRGSVIVRVICCKGTDGGRDGGADG